MSLKLLIDICGVTAEMLMLAYFYGAILGGSTATRVAVRATYLSGWLLALAVASGIKAAFFRTVCSFGVDCWPIWLYQGKLSIKVVLAAIFIAMQLMGEMMAWALLALISPQGGGSYDVHSLTMYTQGVLLSKCLALLMVLILIRLKKARDYRLAPRQFALYLVIPIISIVAIYALAYTASTLRMTINYYNLLLIGVFVIAFNMILFHSLDNSVEIVGLKQEKHHHEQQVQLQADYRQALSSESRGLRKIKHDLQNHFAVLMAYLEQDPTQKAYQYLQDLAEQAPSTIVHLTGHETLDAIFSLKNAQAQARQINIHYEIRMESPVMINDVDLTAIFSNGLDNAIEAVAGLTTKTAKTITLTLHVDQQSLLAEITNPVQQRVKPDANGRFLTSKADGQAHGLGLSNIQDAVERHQGTVTKSCDDHQFCLEIFMDNTML